MKLNNVTELRPDDFAQEDRRAVEQIAGILNPFMQQLVEIMDKRIDFENRVENYLEIEMTVDSSGIPVLNNKISTGKTYVRGLPVINAYSTVNATITPTEQPFISFTQLSNGFVQVNKITGLPANQKFRLNIIVY